MWRNLGLQPLGGSKLCFLRLPFPRPDYFGGIDESLETRGPILSLAPLLVLTLAAVFQITPSQNRST